MTLVLCSASVLALTGSASAEPGDLDSTFDSDGIVITDFPAGGDDVARAVAIQGDGKIVVAGSSDGLLSTDFGLARYTTDGAPDTTFTGAARVTTDFTGAEGDDRAFGVIVLPNGKIVAVGKAQDSGDVSRFALARYLTDGTLDPDFGGGDGMVRTLFPGRNAFAYELVRQPGGKLVVVGEACTATQCDVALVRYTPGGARDTTFSGDGRVRTDFFGNDDGAWDVALQADGKIVVVGWARPSDTERRVALARYRSNGELDRSFSGDGKIATRLSSAGAFDFGNSIGIRPDGKIVVGVEVGDGFGFVRYRPSGRLDTTFGGGDGKVIRNPTEPDDNLEDMALQADGKIVAVGYQYGGPGVFHFEVARYRANGRINAGFGTNGVVVTDFGSPSRAHAVAIQEDGRMVVAGEAEPADDDDFALVRYLAA
jgi:uncharacterized delta-60 repeat protein